jgi:hypothetical protein
LFLSDLQVMGRGGTRLALAGGMRVSSRRGSTAMVVMLTTLLSVSQAEKPRLLPDKAHAARGANHVVWGDGWIGRTEGEHVVWGDSPFGDDNVAWGNLFTSTSKPANTRGSLAQA